MTHGRDTTELEKAMRVVEARRGELKGVATRGDGRTAARWVQIWRNWDWLWPEKILPATTKANVTQARVLKYIDERTKEKNTCNGRPSP